MLQPQKKGDGPVSLELKYDSYAKALAFLAVLRKAGPSEAIRGMNKVLVMWQREVVRHMPVDNGIARASVQVARAEMDGGGRISGAVGGNVEHLKYLEFGAENARGLMKALTLWREGAEPILHWYAKDMGITDLEAKRDRAKTDKSRANYQKRIDKANASSTEEFAPPFRGSWQLIEGDVVAGLRKQLADVIRTGRGMGY